MGCGCGSPGAVMNPDRVDLTHFDILKVVGKGGFGKVNAVEHKKEKKLYAMKTLKKSMLLKSDAYLNTMWIERSVMARFKSKFLVQLHYAFQDDQDLYLVMDFMKGGDLRYYLDKHGQMTEAQCRFYAAELLLALEEMNSLLLVYRDLKPENVLLDEFGHIRVSDFGLVYDLKNEKDHMTMGEAGTRGYLGPEVLMGRYGTSQDVWSYGVTVFELLHRGLPFKSRDEVLNGELWFQTQLSNDCKDFLRRLLEKKVSRRLGCDPVKKWDEVKQHPWFKGIDWAVCAQQGLQPPFIPEADVANCSAVFDLEDQFFGDTKKIDFTPQQQAKFNGFEFNNIVPKPGAKSPSSPMARMPTQGTASRKETKTEMPTPVVDLKPISVDSGGHGSTKLTITAATGSGHDGVTVIDPSPNPAAQASSRATQQGLPMQHSSHRGEAHNTHWEKDKDKEDKPDILPGTVFSPDPVQHHKANPSQSNNFKDAREQQQQQQGQGQTGNTTTTAGGGSTAGSTGGPRRVSNVGLEAKEMEHRRIASNGVASQTNTSTPNSTSNRKLITGEGSTGRRSPSLNSHPLDDKKPRSPNVEAEALVVAPKARNGSRVEATLLVTNAGQGQQQQNSVPVPVAAAAVSLPNANGTVAVH